MIVKIPESGAVCGEGGGECYKTRLERWARIETLEFILSVMGAYPKVQACDKLWGLQSTRWSLECWVEMKLGEWRRGRQKPRHDFSINVAYKMRSLPKVDP